MNGLYRQNTRGTFRTAAPVLWSSGAPLGLALLAACTSHELQTPNPLPEVQTQIFRDVNPIRELDILFVIDNSGSMLEEQMNLKNNFPAFVNELRKIPGGLPDIHMAVVSSDVGAGSNEITGNFACNRIGGDKGEFQGANRNCGLNANATFIISQNGGDKEQDNFDNAKTLEDVFGCIAELGTTGCGYEHQLQSMRLAFATDFTPKNAGFLRPAAFLAIIFITDEDDCSGDPRSTLYTDPAYNVGQQASLRCGLVGHECDGKNPPNGMEFTSTLGACKADPTPNGLIPVKEFIDYIKGLKAQAPNKIIVSAITGWPTNPAAAVDGPYAIRSGLDAQSGQMLFDIEPVCTSNTGKAAPALRMKEFVDSFGQNGIMENICSSDFTPALKRIGALIAVNLTPGCITDKLLDSDRDLSNGFQGECVVTNRIPDAQTGDFKNVNIPACNSDKTNLPCYELLASGDAGNSCAAGQWSIKVNRQGEAPADTREAISCRACADIGGDSTTFCK